MGKSRVACLLVINSYVWNFKAAKIINKYMHK